MSREKLTFAMGCFWGPEDRFARIPGVTGTRVGYAGGEAAGRPDGIEHEASSAAAEGSEAGETPDEETAAGFAGFAGAAREAAFVGEKFAPREPSDAALPGAELAPSEQSKADAAPSFSGSSPAALPRAEPAPTPTHRRLHGHSEVVEVEFDPDIVSLEELLRRFWSEHNPAAIEGYKPEDPRYRSLLFYRSEEQRAVMERIGREMAAQGRASGATGLRPLGAFYLAEEKHQRYEEKKRLRNGGSESSERGSD